LSDVLAFYQISETVRSMQLPAYATDSQRRDRQTAEAMAKIAKGLEESGPTKESADA